MVHIITESEVKRLVLELSERTPVELFNALDSETRGRFGAGLLAGEAPLDAVLRWYKQTFVPAWKKHAHQPIGLIVTKLAQPKSAADLAAIKLISDFLIEYTEYSNAPTAKAIIGVALLMLWAARHGSSDDATHV